MSEAESAPNQPAQPTEEIGLSPESVPRARRPRLVGEVVYREEADEAIDAMLAEVLMQAHGCVRTFGDFQFAVSGSPDMEPILRRMMYDPMLREFPWSKTRVWALDDVAPTESVADARDSVWPRSRVIVDVLADHSGIPRNQLHAIGGAPWPDVSSPGSTSQLVAIAAGYERELRETLGWRPKGHDRLDCLMTSLGPRGELGCVSTGDQGRLVGCESVGEGSRVGLTLSFVNATRLISVLAVGEAARGCLAGLDLKRPRQATGGAPGDAAQIRPLAGEVRWYVDRAACE